MAIYEIARALDIDEGREEPLVNLEGALLTTPERDRGKILLNCSSSRQRRRFTLGHELGHFLNEWHQPTAPNGSLCSRADMGTSDLRSRNRYIRQEAEANSFAIELLTPRKRLRSHLAGDADLRHVLEIANECDISREAAARRYVQLHDDCLAVVFSKQGTVTYAEPARSFPVLTVGKGTRVPLLPIPFGQAGLSDIEEAEARDWLRSAEGVQLTVQALHQQDGFATTLLHVTAPDDDASEPDSFDRFSAFGRG